ncbi:MAG: PEP-CTERM sorting domain-containing protein [Phycisphaerae bacterium]|nr:PEP-CTERM sorting domain-containing protein [Phycisphaerae bacterium]MDW8263172.1 PEP-CTERM sorting domain-containing protein [Phycisphaerales bacterium]
MGENTLSAKLNRHFAAMGAAAAAVAGIGMVQQTEAAIVSSGPVNINIPSTTAGVYLNVVTGVFSTNPASAPGWDVNPWSSTTLNFFSPSAPTGGVYVRLNPAATGVSNLPFGTIIGPASNYTTGGPNTTDSPFVLNSSNNLVGFRFQNENNANQIHYGWMRISLSSTLAAQPRAIVEYAYEDQAGVPIGAGVPEPASLGLLALGAMGLMARRR